MFGGALLFFVFALGSVTDQDGGANSTWFAPLATTALVMALVGVAGMVDRRALGLSGAALPAALITAAIRGSRIDWTTVASTSLSAVSGSASRGSVTASDANTRTPPSRPPRPLEPLPDTYQVRWMTLPT